MAEKDGQEKTEQPSSKKLTEGREEGQVARSVEINSFAIFTSGLLLVYMTQSFLGSQISNFTKQIFGSLDVLNITRANFEIYATEGFTFYLITLGPIFIGLVVIALAASISQVGFKISGKALQPKFSKLNPLNGIKNIFFSSRSLVEVAKSLLKLVIIGLFAYIVLKDFVQDSTALVEFTISEILKFMIDAAYTLLWKIALLYAILAGLDFIFQKYKFKQEMMMTKQEVKEENKQSEGDPQLKARIKKAQFAASKNRMMQDVPKADVVITNPTHFAIALKYDMNKDAAPMILAKGMDAVAQKIKAVAAENNIPMHEDRELARALYKSCNVGDQIPAALFKAVAQILAYVFQLKNSKKKKSIV